MNAARLCLLALLVAAPAAPAWAKDEIIDTRKKAPQAPPNPLRDIADDMTQAARYLQAIKVGELTRDKQDEIIEKLEKLIEAARQQQQASSGQGSGKRRQQRKPQPQPASQQQKSQQAAKAQQQQQSQGNRPGMGRAGRRGEQGDIHTDAQEWGNLPPSVRDALLQTLGEGFPHKYRALLQRYYRAISKPPE